MQCLTGLCWSSKSRMLKPGRDSAGSRLFLGVVGDVPSFAASSDFNLLWRTLLLMGVVQRELWLACSRRCGVAGLW